MFSSANSALWYEVLEFFNQWTRKLALDGCHSWNFLYPVSHILIIFNHIFVPSQKNPSKEKTPSWVADLLIISSFILALICSIFAALVIRWRRLKKQIPPTLQKQSKALEKGSTQASDALEEPEIHFGGRPNFEDICAKFPDEKGGSDIGVLVCGPKTMKESVASICQRKFGAKKQKPNFSFHSLNFTL